MDATSEHDDACGSDSEEQSVFGKRGRPFFRLRARQLVEGDKTVKQKAEEYFADLDVYTYMAHFVAKELHQRPNDILDHWGVAELIVAFGQYANEKSNQNYEDWKHLDGESRAKVQKPSKYVVYFMNEG